MSGNQGNSNVPLELSIQVGEKERSGFIRDELAKLKEARKQASIIGSSPSKPVIQKVPPILNAIKEEEDFKKYFEPRLVALGPLHHGNPKFERAEQTKRKLAILFAEENGKAPEVLFDIIMAEIQDLRKCYNAEDIGKYSDEKLAWMFFIDGCAVLFAIDYGLKGNYDKLNIKADLLVYAQLDFFLLENQLPFRVLQILIDSAKDPTQLEESVTKFLQSNLITNIQSDEQNYKYRQISDNKSHAHNAESYAHLLQRFRSTHLTEKEDLSSNSIIGTVLLWWGGKRKHRKTLRSIKEFKESGIHVKPINSNNLKNISFYCNFMGSLKMPCIMVDDSTASKFMNLVALEMCRDFKNDFEVTSYLCFLDSLIDTAEDVKELRVRGMLHNYLGSDEQVAHLLNTMSSDLVPDQDMHKTVRKNMNKFSNNPLTATLVQGYYTHFSSPWTFLAFTGAILGLFFSAIQAYTAVFGGRD